MNKISKWFEGYRGVIWILVTQIIMLAFTFYPFLRWDWQLRGTLLEDIFKPGYAAQATFGLMLLYYIINIVLAIYWFRSAEQAQDLLHLQITEMYEELQALRKENDELREKLKDNA